MFQKIAILGAIAVALAGCGGGGSPAINNPNFFSFKSRDGVLSGAYNPAGFTKTEGQARVKGACASNTLASYGESAPTEAGLIPFSATCQGAPLFATGAVEVEKAPEGL